MKNKYLILFIIFIIIIIYKNYDEIKIWLLNRIIFNRGILSPNRFWYLISDLFLSDGAGIDLYNDYKNKYGDFAKATMFDEELYVVTNINYIKTILDNSPDIFGVGKIKHKFFNQFMPKNVGVSTGCPWMKRRQINENALDTGKLHRYSEIYNNILSDYLLNNKKDNYDFNNFNKLGRYMTAKIIFNKDKINEDVFNYLSEINNSELFINPNYKVKQSIKDNFINTIKGNINNPEPQSLIESCLSISNDKEEIYNQIPHFIFPISGLFITTIPRILIMIFNHDNIFKKVLHEINSISNNSHNIYNSKVLRYCVLETLRLINPLITTFRSLLIDYRFDDNYKFKKNTQFLILNNPVLRENEYFNEPNKFIPERWNGEMEVSYYAIMFNQGPQKCPSKELVVFLCQIFIYHFFKVHGINNKTKININKIDTEMIPQITNPFSFKISIN